MIMPNDHGKCFVRESKGKMKVHSFISSVDSQKGVYSVFSDMK